jgi:hypothetical protein
VIVEIGPERKQYELHKALLIHHSEYFSKAFQGSWKEADEGVIRLSDIEEITCESALQSTVLRKRSAYARVWYRLYRTSIVCRSFALVL